jgi:glycosyltransferase involved in cell wall biosynthesis
VTFPVFPPQGGGQVRIFQLFRQLATVYDVEIVTLGVPGTPARRMQLSPGLHETRIPKSPQHAREEARLERSAGTLVTDVAFARLYRLTPDYLEALRRASRDARAVIASHPYPLPAILEVSDAPIWYEAQDVECLLKVDVLPDNDTGRELLAEVEAVERQACERAEFVWACSEEDRSQLVSIYGVDASVVLVVPNGVALEELTFVPPSVRDERKRRLGMDRCLSVFIGSWHAPNVVAAERVLDAARERPGLGFTIVGSVGRAFSEHPVPDNVDIAGTVSSEFRRELLGIADVALNPVTTGSGTNIKMLDYFGAGVPVVSTEFGARGLGVLPGTHYEAADPDRLGQVIEALYGSDVDRRERMSVAAEEHVREKLTWSVIGRGLLASLH